MKKVAGLLKRRFENIMTYLTHPITNATSESINAKIQWVKYTARGFRDKQNFINAIYLHSIDCNFPFLIRGYSTFRNDLPSLMWQRYFAKASTHDVA